MPPVVGQSSDANVAGISGENTAGGLAGRFNTSVEVGGNVSAGGNVNARGNVNASGNVSARGNLNADGNVNVRSNITVSGNESTPGNVNANGNINARGNVSANGNVNASGNVNAANINVTGDIRLQNADCAEEFDVETVGAPPIAPGTVVVLAAVGCLRPSSFAYDKRVAGVVSGGGDYKPGIILDQKSAQSDRVPVALLGKVFCNVDATHESVEVGDLLTTSDTPGHAMKASDSSRAFGAVIGKALQSLPEGKALLPILVALH
jgi:hypothetical protein